MILNSPYITGSLTVTGNTILSGSVTLAAGSSLAGTASLATTASYAVTATTASYATNSTTASYAVDATTAATASYANAFTVANTLTAQTLVVQTITSSIDFVTGSTRFGSSTANTHTFTGSMNVSGSVTAAGGLILNASQAITTGGSIGFNSTQGVFVYGKTGTSYDFKLYNGVGSTVIQVPTGTQNVEFLGNTTITAGAGATLSLVKTSNNIPSLTLTGANYDSYIDGGNYLAFGTSGSYRMFISASGNIGVGTTTPLLPFVVSNGTNCLEFTANYSGNQSYLQSINRSTSAYTPMTYYALTQTLYAGANRVMDITGSNVGIGTSSPTETFTLAGSARITGQATDFSAGTRGINIDVISSSGNGRIYMVNGTSTAGDLLLGTANTERMRITSGGNVGIGTTTPQRAFVVARSNGQGIEFDNQTGYSTILSYNRTTSTYTPLTMGEGTTNVGIGTTSPGSKLEVNGNVTVSGIIAAGTTSGNDTGLRVDYGNGSSDYGRLRFYENGAQNNTIHSFSNAWSSTFTGGSRGAINIQGYNGVTFGPWNAPDMYITNSTGNTYIKGTLTVNSTITENSSLRYKENVETIKYGLDEILKMRGVSYTKKDTQSHEIGVIAEEVNELVPEVVIKSEEGEVESVAYGRLTAVLIEAVKELQAQINELKAK
jgi:hypothetical protein